MPINDPLEQPAPVMVEENPFDVILAGQQSFLEQHQARMEAAKQANASTGIPEWTGRNLMEGALNTGAAAAGLVGASDTRKALQEKALQSKETRGAIADSGVAELVGSALESTPMTVASFLPAYLLKIPAARMAGNRAHALALSKGMTPIQAQAAATVAAQRAGDLAARVGMAGSMGVLSTPDAYDQAKEAGQSDGKALANAIASMFVEGGMSLLMPKGVEGAMLGNGAKNVAAQGFKKTAVNTGKKLAADIVDEAVEEGLTEVAHIAHESALGVSNGALGTDENLKRVGMATGAGGLMGPGFNAPGAVSDLWRSMRRPVAPMVNNAPVAINPVAPVAPVGLPEQVQSMEQVGANVGPMVGPVGPVVPSLPEIQQPMTEQALGIPSGQPMAEVGIGGPSEQPISLPAQGPTATPIVDSAASGPLGGGFEVGQVVQWARGKKKGEQATVVAVRPDGRVVVRLASGKVQGEKDGITPGNLEVVNVVRTQGGADGRAAEGQTQAQGAGPAVDPVAGGGGNISQGGDPAIPRPGKNDAVRFALKRREEGATLQQVHAELRNVYGLKFHDALRISNDVFAVEEKPKTPSRPEDLLPGPGFETIENTLSGPDARLYDPPNGGDTFQHLSKIAQSEYEKSVKSMTQDEIKRTGRPPQGSVRLYHGGGSGKNANKGTQWTLDFIYARDYRNGAVDFVDVPIQSLPNSWLSGDGRLSHSGELPASITNRSKELRPQPVDQPKTEQALGGPREQPITEESSVVGKTFQEFLKSRGMTEDEYSKKSAQDSDLISQPDGDTVTIGESKIHGHGVFVNHETKSGEVLGLALDRGLHRTPVGRFVNHSENPNAVLKESERGVEVVALRPIRNREEVSINYESVDQFKPREKLAPVGPAIGTRLRYKGGKNKGQEVTLAEIFPDGKWVVKDGKGKILGKRNGLFPQFFEVVQKPVPQEVQNAVAQERSRTPETKATVAPGDVGVSGKTAEGARTATNGPEGQTEVGSGLPGSTVDKKHDEVKFNETPRTDTVQSLDSGNADRAGDSAASDVEVEKTDAADEMDPIEDYGEKIGGAKKDRLSLSDFDSLSPEEQQTAVTKATAWPEDTTERIANGQSLEIAHVVQQIRSAISPVPILKDKEKTDPAQRASAIRQYLDLVGQIGQRLKNVKTEKEIEAIYSDIFDHKNDRVGFNQKYWRIAKNKVLNDAFQVGYNTQKKATKAIRNGWPNQEKWLSRYEVYESRTVMDDRSIKSEWVVRARNPEQRRNEWSQEKAGELLRNYDTKEEAQAEAARRYEGLQRTGAGKQPTRPLNPDLERVGTDHRDGRDVTPEEIAKTFGFRGIEFGNWTNQADRQQSINQAFDALHDLAALMGKPPKALSLDGRLGIAFGSRGSGKAAAHYERGKVVINLTRTKGAGTLAHEWAHAVDNYFGKMGFEGDIHRFLSQAKDSEKAVRDIAGKTGVRPEMVEAWIGIRKAIHEAGISPRQVLLLKLADDVEEYIKTDKNLSAEAAETVGNRVMSAAQRFDIMSLPQKEKDAFSDMIVKIHRASKTPKRTDFLAESGSKDAKRKEPYWSSEVELFARSFETWANQRLEDAGKVSPYLVQGVPSKGNTKEGEEVSDWFKLYPRGEEADKINGAIDTLVGELKSETTPDGNERLFSPRRTPGDELSGDKPQWHRSQDEAQSMAADDRPIEIVKVPSGTVKDAIKELHGEIKKHQGKEYTNSDSGISVLVNGVGIDHAEGTATFNSEIAAMTKLGELIENAVASKPEKTTKNHINSAIKMFVPVKVGDQKMVIKITALEHRSDGKHRFYDLGSVEIVENKKPQPDYGPGRDAKALPRPTSVGGTRSIFKNQLEGNGQDSGSESMKIVENKDPQPDYGPGRDAEAVPRPASVGDNGSISQKESKGNGQDSGPLYGPKRVVFPSGNRSIETLISWAQESVSTMRLQMQGDIDRLTDPDRKQEKRAQLELFGSVDPQVMAEHMRAFPQHYLAQAERKIHPAWVFLERHDAPPAESRIAVDAIAMQEGEWKAPDTKKAIEDLEGGLRKVMKKPPTLSVSKGLPEEAGGMFDPKNRGIETRWHNALDTVAHEMAHALEEEVGLVKAAETDANIRSDLVRASQHGTIETDPHRRLQEGMAEVVRAWMVAPEQARARHPSAVAFIESKIDPAILTPLREYGDKVRKFFGSSAIGRMAAVQSSTVDAAEKEREERGVFQILKDLAYSTIGKRSRNDYKRKKLGQVPSGWRRDRARKLGGKWEAFKEAMGYHFHDADLPLINNWNLAVMMGGMDPEKMRPSELLPRWLDFVRGSGGRVRDMILRHGLADREMNAASFANGERMTLGNLVKPLFDISPNDGDMGKNLDIAHAVGSAQRTLEISKRKRAKMADEIQRLIEEKGPAIKELPYFRKEIAEKELENDIEKIRQDTTEEIARLTAAGGELESSEDVARQALDEFKAMPENQRKAIEQYLDNYRQWADWNIQYRINSGMLSPDSARDIRDMNQYYIDWHRVFADEKSGIYGAVKGSTRTIQNPLISLLVATEKTVAVGDQNFLMQILTDPLRLAQKVGNGVALSELGRQVSEADAEEAFKHHDGLIEHNGAPAKIYRMKRLMTEEQKDGPPIEWVVQEYWVFDAGTEASLELARNEGADHPWVQAMAAINSLQRASIVLTPAFSLRTLTRDNLERIIVSEGKTTSEGYKKWWEGELDGKDLQERYDLSGASLAGMTGRTRDQMMRDIMGEILAKDGSRWSTVGNFAKKYKHFQEWAEGVARKTEFAQAWTQLKKEHPDWSEQDLALESMSRSRNLLDTAKKGALIGRMNALTLFLNAGIKGMVVNTRLARKAYAAARAGRTDEAAALSGALALRVATLSAVSMLIRWMVLGMNDDEKQKKLMAEPGFMRDFSFRIDIPGLPKISLAKPYEMGWFTSGAERLADAMWAKGRGWDAEAARQVTELGKMSGWLGGLKNTITPMKPEDLGGSFLPIIEVMANKDFFRNQTIVSPWETGEAVKLRKGTERASGLGQGLQALTADTVDARNIDHLIQSFFGGFGRMATAKDGTGFMRSATGMVGGSDTVSGSRDVRWVLEKLTEIGQGQGREARNLQRLLKDARNAKTDEGKEKLEQTALRVAAGLRKSLENNPKRWEKKEE